MFNLRRQAQPVYSIAPSPTGKEIKLSEVKGREEIRRGETTRDKEGRD